MQVRACFSLLVVLNTPVWSQIALLNGAVRFVQDYIEDVLSATPESVKIYKEYDFIIVGAGTAGCVLANRLTENPEWQVLLIEAGEDENYLMDMPLLVPFLQQTKANWNYFTEPSNSYCTAMKNKQCKFPRGKVMGGSSVLNYMLYTRGNSKDYDRWADLGNTDWSFHRVLPYFKKLETFTILNNSIFHGYEGPLSISYPKVRTPIGKLIIKGNLDFGIPYTDYNGKNQIGVSYFQVTQKDGMRHSGNKAYLYPIKRRKNLHILKGTLVQKIIFGENNTVQSVLVERNDDLFRLKARKEIILSAGAINSPQILMLSGIGPKKELKRLGIPLRKNLPVGQNLMDHIATGITFTINSAKKDYTSAFQLNKIMDAIPQYLTKRDGLLTLPGGCEAVTFFDMMHPNITDGFPDIELMYVTGKLNEWNIIGETMGVESKYLDYYADLKDRAGFTIMPMVMHPRSRGNITLVDKNPRSKPKIVPNYYADKQDVQTMIDGIHLALDLTSQGAFAKEGVSLYKLPMKECPYEGNKYWECFIRHFTFTIYHLSGTCRMGPEDDPRSVVDQRLRVYGINNLRVIDASIMPEIITGHTNGPVFMIAERAADLIKEDWGNFGGVPRFL